MTPTDAARAYALGRNGESSLTPLVDASRSTARREFVSALAELLLAVTPFLSGPLKRATFPP